MPTGGGQDGPVTLAAIARAAGVSESTVSRVFTNPEKVATRTRDRVRRLGEQLGYEAPAVPRPRATTGALGLVVPDLANPFFPPIVQAAARRAATWAMTVVVTETGEQPVEEPRLAEFLASRVDGLILASPRSADEVLRGAGERVPTVLINREVPTMASVSIDVESGLGSAVEHLAALGHRRIAYLSGPRASWSNERRRDIVTASAERFGLALREFGPFEPVVSAGVHAADLVMAADATAVIAFDDLIALGAMARFQSRGLVIGRDVSVVGIDDSPMAVTAYPSLTSVHLPAATAAERAVDVLRTALWSPATPALQARLDARLVVRESTGPVLTSAPATR